jgi:hypothetical protein
MSLVAEDIQVWQTRIQYGNELRLRRECPQTGGHSVVGALH